MTPLHLMEPMARMYGYLPAYEAAYASALKALSKAEERLRRQMDKPRDMTACPRSRAIQDRRDAIVMFIGTRKTVNGATVCALFPDETAATIRSDLKVLTDIGAIRRVKTGVYAPIVGRIGIAETKLHERIRRRHDRIEDFLRRNPGCSRNRLSNACGISGSDFWFDLSIMRAERRVWYRKIPQGQKFTFAFYAGAEA